MKVFKLFLAGLAFKSALLFACPTCVGRIKPESPLFFSDEFYKPGTASAIIQDSKEQRAAQEFKKLLSTKREKK